MTDQAGVPPREAVLVAQMLGAAPEQLTGVKLVPGETVRAVDLPPGWRIASEEDVTFSDDHGRTQRTFTRYDTPDGPVIIVRHEGGDEIFAVISAVADVSGVIGGISMMVTAVKKLGGYWRTRGAKTRRRSYTGSGEERESAELDDDKPVADQIKPPTGGTGKPA